MTAISALGEMLLITFLVFSGAVAVCMWIGILLGWL